jgi:hypothetical protein
MKGFTIKADQTMTVNGTLTVPNGATLAVAGTVNVKDGGTLVSAGLGADGLPDEDSKIAFIDRGKVMFQKGATGFYGTRRFIGGDNNDGFYQWDTEKAASATVTLTNNTTKLNGTVTAINDIVIAADTTMVIDEASTLKVKEGVTFTVAGTLNVVNSGTVMLTSGNTNANGAKLALAGGTDNTVDNGRGGKLTGDGKVVAGATEIVGGKGGWQAVGANSSIAIEAGATANAKTAIITATSGGVLTAGVGAIITQTAKEGNLLTVAENTEIVLGGGSNGTAVGKLILVGGTNAGEIKLAGAGTSIVSTGATQNTPLSNASKIGGNTFQEGSGGKASVYTTTGDSAGKFAKLLGGAAGNGLKGGDASNTITIDASQGVTAASTQ